MGAIEETLSQEFRHLLEVCRHALSRGNRAPGAILLGVYREEARRLADKAHRRADFIAARAKARRLAALLAGSDDERQHGSDDESPHAAVHRRRQRDPLANLALDRRQTAAAGEIADVFEATVRALTARVRPTDTPRIDRSRIPDAPFAGMTPRQAQARHERYLPWVAANQHLIARRGSDELKAADLVLRVLIDRTPVGRIDKRYRLRHGTAGRALRAALDAYADLLEGRERT